jgi:hypothetical protein
MDNNIVSIYIDIIFNIILSYYNINNNIDEDPILEMHIINFIKHCLFKFSYEKLGYCLIQEFDKINFMDVKNDVIEYKFREKDRIYVSQFANKIHFYIEKNK